ncbi:hypothetical protein [Salinilacihabitans rarus]|uniref:hypothetical protein n=1 Tax=Salinilacihabitans rarus TaxID=2961596 RepID=UPI0020C8ED62|nr:hypothetical protein [Salinilacihabitans rarus]
MSRAPLLVALLVVLAGCGALPGGDAQADREPYGVDEPVDPPSGPPGFSADGLEDPAALWAAHEETLADRSYAVRGERELTYENGTVYRAVEYATLLDRGDDRGYTREAWRGTDVDDGDAVETERWTDDRGVVVRERFANGSVEYREGTGFALASNERRLRAILSVVEDPDVMVAEDGTYVIEASEASAASIVADEPFHAEIRVHEAGVVEYAELEGTVDYDGERLRISERVGIDAVDGTTVVAPDWVDEARAAPAEGSADEDEGEGEPRGD